MIACTPVQQTSCFCRQWTKIWNAYTVTVVWDKVAWLVQSVRPRCIAEDGRS